jgi:recombination protein RecA
MGVSIEEVVRGANALFGSNSVQRLTEKKAKKIPVFRTGIPPLDIAVGVGGLPKGRVIEIFGPESCGKTSTVLTFIAEAQRKNAWVWYGDMEHSLDPTWAEKLGVNLDHFLLSQPMNAEECLELAQYHIRTGVIDIIVVDSVASLVPSAEVKGKFGESHMGLQARLMSQAMRKLTSILSRTECIAIFINQIREKIGQSWGNPETTPGGRALKFYSSVRIDVRMSGLIGPKENPEGKIIKFTVKKNKVAAPFKMCETDFLFSDGINFNHSLFYAGVATGVIEKSGKSYSIDGVSLGIGKNAAIEYIANMTSEWRTEIYNRICNSVLEKKMTTEERIKGLEEQLEKESNEEEKAKIKEKIDVLKQKMEELPEKLPEKEEEGESDDD